MARSTARAAAMQMIFEHVSGGEGGEETLQMVYDELREETANDTEPVRADEPGKGDRSYISEVLSGVLEHLDDLDEKIAAASRGWTIERMPRVDLTILRLACWEILYRDDVPGSVAINEAVELANRYSDPDNSSRFINGVLGTILREKEAQA
jgi:transcription antitermination protein NusB